MEKITGPISYLNWKAAEAGEKAIYAFEFPLFTDAHIIGEITDILGPYKFLNTVAFYKQQPIAPSIILRFDEHLTRDPIKKEMTKTDTSQYHGGWLVDEIAALLSLCLGIRIKAGGQTRIFEEGKDPKGHPEYHAGYRDPVYVKRIGYQPIIPSATKEHTLNDAQQIIKYIKLSPSDALALVKSARLYQDALWISESEPALSWIFFVSSIEVAANHWARQHGKPLNRLKSFRPELEKLLSEHCPEVKEDIADMLSDYMGSTKKFIDFLLHFLPLPPPKRPPKWGQIDWDPKKLSKSLRIIYDHRSKALHGGTPFPEFMCSLKE